MFSKALAVPIAQRILTLSLHLRQEMQALRHRGQIAYRNHDGLARKEVRHGFRD